MLGIKARPPVCKNNQPLSPWCHLFPGQRQFTIGQEVGALKDMALAATITLTTSSPSLAPACTLPYKLGTRGVKVCFGVCQSKREDAGEVPQSPLKRGGQEEVPRQGGGSQPRKLKREGEAKESLEWGAQGQGLPGHVCASVPGAPSSRPWRWCGSWECGQPEWGAWSWCTARPERLFPVTSRGPDLGMNWVLRGRGARVNSWPGSGVRGVPGACARAPRREGGPCVRLARELRVCPSPWDRAGGPGLGWKEA